MCVCVSRGECVTFRESVVSKFAKSDVRGEQFLPCHVDEYFRRADLGQSVPSVFVPSEIYFDVYFSRLISFPLSPLFLFLSLALLGCVREIFSLRI